MKKSLDLFFCVDAPFTLGFFTTLVTLLESFSSEVTPVINILDCGLKQNFLDSLHAYIKEHPKKPTLNVCKLPEEYIKPFKEQTSPLNSDIFRKSTISKVALPVLFPDCEFGVYVDCDIYIQRDLSELLKYENGDAHFYAVPDNYIHTLGSSQESIDPEVFKIDPDAPYFNAGFFVMNLRGFDRDSYWKRVQAVSQLGKLRWEDQSLLNISLCGQWKSIPNSWNTMKWPEEREYLFPKKNTNYHFFGGQKPWHFTSLLSIGLVPRFYKVLNNHIIEGVERPKLNRSHGLWWIKNFVINIFSRSS